MPSRAVLRKKARREAKRSKQVTVGESNVPTAGEPPVAPSTAVAQPERRAERPVPHAPARAPAVVRAPHESVAATPAPRAGTKRAREPAPAEEPIPEGLTRKERRREVAKRILEKQLARVNAAAAASAAAAESRAEGDTPLTDVKDRHDPRFNGGTFWRTRKERRARTLFLGGLPVNMSSQQVKDFISTIVDSDSMAVDYLNQLDEGVEAVEEVDFLPNQHSKVRNSYVTLASVPIAGCAAAKLDGYKMEGRFLRCNFAADKTQRSIAINRRSSR